MPFVLLTIGILFLIVAIKGTQGQAFDMLRAEFTGSNSFVVFASAIFVLGALAYIRPIRPIAVGMLGLVILAMVLANKGGFFTALNRQLRAPIAPAGNPGGNPASNPASTTLQTAPSSILPGVANPYFANPGMPLMPGIEPPATGGGFGQY